MRKDHLNLGGLLAIGLGALVAAMTALPLHADSAAVKDLQGTAGLLPLEKIVDKARARRPGHLIEAELKSLNGIQVYEIEMLDEGGKVWEMYFNAKTGELIKQGEEKGGEDTGR